MMNAKKQIALLLAMVIAMVTLAPATVTQAKVKISGNKKLILTVGTTDTVSAKGKGISFKSSNKKVVTVSKKGKVKAKKVGTCNIVVSDGKNKVKAKVTVVPENVSLQSVKIVGDDYAESAAKAASINVQWKAAKGATGYYVYYATKKNGKYKTKTVKGGKKTSLKISGLAYGNTYFVKVKAFGGKKKIKSSKFSDVKSVKTYAMKWNDEFNGTKLDTTKWNDNGVNITYGSSTNYTLDQLKIENGNAVITPEIQWDPVEEHIVKTPSSAKLWTNGLKTFKYGKIKFRAKLPKGEGTSAYGWMLGEKEDWPGCGEIDIFETTYAKDKNDILQAIHCNKFNGMLTSSGVKYKSNIVNNVTSAYHIYEIEWMESKIDFYIDGTKTWTYDANKYKKENATADRDIWPFCQPFFLVMQCSVGGPEGVDAYGAEGNVKKVNPTGWTKIATDSETGYETYQDYMYIDYVRVYE